MKLAMHIVGLRTKCFMYLKIKRKTTSMTSLSNYGKIKTAAALKKSIQMTFTKLLTTNG